MIIMLCVDLLKAAKVRYCFTVALKEKDYSDLDE